ncbi:hypothetical protein J437_LFUL008792, partial [Ladona fulva]
MALTLVRIHLPARYLANIRILKSTSSTGLWRLHTQREEDFSSSSQREYWSGYNGNYSAPIAGVIGAAVASWMIYHYVGGFKKQNNLKALTVPGLKRDDLPSYTLEEVAKHSTPKDKVWITYGVGVYDITDFIDKHPGGDKILMAAGGSVEPFWMLYGVHKDPAILAMMEKYRIGNISEEDAQVATSNMEDPYANEPRRHPALKPSSKKPFNAEPPPSLLVDSFLTP